MTQIETPTPPRYRPSQNPYWKKIQELEAHSPNISLDASTESLSGRWRERLPAIQNSSELHVEIGCNGGHWILGQAQKNTNALWIGLDYKFKQIYLAHEKARKRNITQNLIFLRAKAERLSHVFGPQEITHLYLFFPDPWPREKQNKHRLFNEAWLRSIAPCLSQEGRFEIKTDHPGYFEYMKQEVAKASDVWSVVETQDDLYRDHPSRESLAPPQVTLFERVFILEGKPIQRLLLARAR